jgi:membrane associated rhomboid family serine protease/Zn-finger nucleic acid-binding protein
MTRQRGTLRCPKCKRAGLTAFSHQGTEIDLCRGCAGLWCERADWDRAALGDQIEVADSMHAAASIVASGSTDVSCPEGHGKLTALRIRGVKGLEIDSCERCGGVWFDHEEWGYLAAFRAWQLHQATVAAPLGWAQWVFQLLLRLPVELNVRPHSKPIATMALMATCVAVFVLSQFTGDEVSLFLAFRPDHLFSWGGVITPVTYQFVHGNWLHLLGNMYFLYIFGDNVEDVFGSGQFLLFFLICGVIAALAEAGVSMDTAQPMVGASGAIAGIMGAYIVLFREARLTMMIAVYQFKAPAYVWLGLWVLIQAAGVSDQLSGSVTGVAWAAHLGGFVAGLSITWLRRNALARRHPLLHLLWTKRLSADDAEMLQASAESKKSA